MIVSPKRWHCAFALLAVMPAMFLTPQATAEEGVAAPGYIVVFKDGVDVDDAVVACSRRYRVTVGAIYRDSLRGMHVVNRRLSPRTLRALAADPRVAFVEPNQIYRITAQTTPTGIDRADVEKAVFINGNDDEIDADIAVIDTGIAANHVDLNVVGGVRPINLIFFTIVLPFFWGDDNGHGTHVAGTAAAIDNSSHVVGAAPGARLTAVKVLNRSGIGLTTTIISGINWVARNAEQIDVANMSLGGGFSQALNSAVRGLAEAGVVPCVSAGNAAVDAATQSPASEPEACTVSALADSDGFPGALGPPTLHGDDDSFAEFSNFGEVIDICAPGVDILSTWNDGNTNTISGTSMSSPHVAGAAALYIARLGISSKSATGVRGVIQAIKDTGWKPGDLEYFTNDPDAFAESLLNVNGLVRRLQNLFRFTTAVSVADQPHGIDAGDIDGDGDIDLATGNWISESFSILRNDGAGNFTNAGNIQAENRVSDVAFLDLEGDGDLDLAAGTRNINKVELWLNDGTGTFTLLNKVPIGNSPSSVAAADLDGDDVKDLVFTSWHDELMVLLSNGDGSFSAPNIIPVGTQAQECQPRDVDAVDLDGDGDRDLAIAYWHGGLMSVLLNNGNGTFAAPTNYPALIEGNALKARDLNGDGFPEIVTASYDPQGVTIFLNDGNAGFGTSVNLSAGPFPTDVAVEDFDQDGDFDIVVSNTGADTVTLLPNLGNGTFAPAQSSIAGTAPWPWMTVIVAADLNGDGPLDVAVGSWGTREVFTALSTLRE